MASSFFRHLHRLLQKLHLQLVKRTPGRLFARTSVATDDDHDDRSTALISDDDAGAVMAKLGLWNNVGAEEGAEGVGGRCRGLSEAAYGMLEEKEACVEELEEAFQVFDEDGDGLISAEELQRVMGKLGWAEGTRLEDCRRMIRVYDQDGDDKISPREFKNLLECAP